MMLVVGCGSSDPTQARRQQVCRRMPLVISRAVSINDLIGLIEEVSGIHATVRHMQKRAFDVPENLLDISKAQRDFGWRPEVGLAEGIRRCMQHMQDSAMHS